MTTRTEPDTKRRQDAAARWLRRLADDVESGEILRCNVLWTDDRARRHQLVVLWEPIDGAPAEPPTLGDGDES